MLEILLFVVIRAQCNVATCSMLSSAQGVEERDVLERFLPNETIRIEDDLDIVRAPVGIELPTHMISRKTHIRASFCARSPDRWKVTYLPPTGVSVGDKLWFAKENAYMMPKDSLSEENGWTESVWLNLRLFETILNQSRTHRVASYVKRLEELLRRDEG